MFRDCSPRLDRCRDHFEWTTKMSGQKTVTQTLQTKTSCIEIPPTPLHQTEVRVFFCKRSEPLWLCRSKLLFGVPTYYYHVNVVALPLPTSTKPVTDTGLCSDLGLVFINISESWSLFQFYQHTRTHKHPNIPVIAWPLLKRLLLHMGKKIPRASRFQCYEIAVVFPNLRQFRVKFTVKVTISWVIKSEW